MQKNKHKRINGWLIKWSPTYEKWQVIHPDGRRLEEFVDLEKAEDFARMTRI